MRKENIVCDRCKKEMKFNIMGDRLFWGENQTIDLCGKCWSSFTRFLKNRKEAKQ